MTVAQIHDQSAFHAAKQVAKMLRPAEDSIDRSIAENANLLHSIVTARLAARVSPELGREAIDTAVAMIANLGEVRRMGITRHRQLTKVRDTLGFGANDVGCTVNKDDRPEGNAAATRVAA